MYSDKIFKILLKLAGLFMVLLFLLVFISLFRESFPSIRILRWHFLYGREWNPVAEKFGALPFIVGTILTSTLALLISLPFSLSLAILLGEYYKSGFLNNFLTHTTDLLAGIPSVIYGFWGIFFLVPIIRKIEMKLGIVPYGVGILTASLVLSIMIIPYASSIAREVIRLVPPEIKEAGLSLGATRFELVRKIIFPYARSGIFAGILLAFGRAFGETMAVTMVIGNYNFLPKNIFSPANTMASLIANEFTEATKDIHLSALIEIGLLLFLITFLINFLGNQIIKKFKVETDGAN